MVLCSPVIKNYIQAFIASSSLFLHLSFSRALLVYHHKNIIDWLSIDSLIDWCTITSRIADKKWETIFSSMYINSENMVHIT